MNMKIIRVDTLDNLKEDVASYLGIDYSELLKVLERYMSNSDTDKNAKKCYRYISRHKKYTLEEFYLCHVAAKLDCDDHMELLPLDKLLTTQNSFSDFLLEHGIKFERSQNSRYLLDLFYKGEHIEWKKRKDTESIGERVKIRLSKNRNLKDLFVNGFQFLYDITHSAQPFYDLYRCTPEFLQDLGRLLGIDLLSDFEIQSKTYIALCRVPKGKIIFDTEDPDHNFEERYIYSAMEYIWKYWKGGSGYNPALRALDTDTVKVEKWVHEEEIEPRH